MRDKRDMESILEFIDGKGYKAYKEISGEYDYGSYTLSVDHVQADPFAAPSKCRAIVSQKDAAFPVELFDLHHKKVAVSDFLTRVFRKNIKKYYEGTGGSGKSGTLAIDRCGQEMLERTSVIIDKNKVEVRFEVGLPAAGRKILGKAASFIFSQALPKIVENSLYYSNIDSKTLRRQVDLAVDQAFLRHEIRKRGLTCFIANGSILPRESGVSDCPMAKGAIPFQSPPSLEIEINLPNKGTVKGMGIPEGITLIVGGGYHGKSTLLSAIELGVYNHIEGDGREYIGTRDNAIKIRAEDGRRVEKVNISPFINNLPNGQDTYRFSTENASGSTSQAANIMEALEMGTDLLLIDEDTSATNFMIRDTRMQKLVSKDKEPITPFIHKARQLYKDYGVSTILVVGGSGDYFDIADLVIMMDEYIPKDVTGRAKEIANSYCYSQNDSVNTSFGEVTPRVILRSGFPEGQKGIRIKPRGLHKVLYNKSEIDLSNIDQLVDISQTNCLAVMLEYLVKRVINDKLTIKQAVDIVYKQIQERGLDGISPYTGHPGNLALPRKYEFSAMLNRYRELRIKG